MDLLNYLTKKREKPDEEESDEEEIEKLKLVRKKRGNKAF